jgi:D-glycero-alpha-D-manno-heptose-7-phosphate kinase
MASPLINEGVIVTRTPLRISFAGGGTDLPDFYERQPGAVFSTAINRYVYVTVKRHGPVFDEAIRITYSRTESVDRIDDIENNIARECLRLLEIEPPIYVSTIGDLPASTGLGGSSAFAVGLLNALHAYRGDRVSAGQLAEEAAHIEINVLGQPIGKQDQYAAAFGGLNLFVFKPGGGVTVEPHRLVHNAIHSLFAPLLVFWTGHQRDAESVLSEQKSKTGDKLRSLERMRDLAYEMQRLPMNGSLDAAALGRIVNDSWQLKRGLASTISNDRIDEWYDRAMNAGALGGKILGAGGGGFLMFVAEPDRKNAVRRALGSLREVPMAYEAHGSRIVSPTGH